MTDTKPIEIVIPPYRANVHPDYLRGLGWVPASELASSNADAEQLRVQLAGCGVAALGATNPEQVAKPGDYGWSASYGDVLRIRREFEAAQSELSRLGKEVEIFTVYFAEALALPDGYDDSAEDMVRQAQESDVQANKIIERERTARQDAERERDEAERKRDAQAQMVLDLRAKLEVATALDGIESLRARLSELESHEAPARAWERGYRLGWERRPIGLYAMASDEPYVPPYEPPKPAEGADS